VEFAELRQHRLGAERDHAVAAGMPPGRAVAADLELSRRAQGCEERLEVGLGVEEVVGAARPWTPFLGLAADEEARHLGALLAGLAAREGLEASKRARSPKPRAWLRAAALRRPGRSEGRRSERSEAMGFAMRRALVPAAEEAWRRPCR
jgi:hypothetical protein